MTNANLSDDGTHGQAPSGTSPSLVLRLRDRWGPDLAEAQPEALGPDDRNLAPYAHLMLPADSDAEEYLATVKEWEAVEHAELPPQISLPATD